MKTTFTVPGLPIGKGRPKFTRTGHTYTPEKTRTYEDKVRLCWKTQIGQTFPAGVPILVSGVAYFPIPKRTSQKKAAELEGAFHLKRPDTDNLVKAVLDALNGHAYPDDSAVMLGLWHKVYTNGAPRVEITLEELPPRLPSDWREHIKTRFERIGQGARL